MNCPNDTDGDGDCSVCHRAKQLLKSLPDEEPPYTTFMNVRLTHFDADELRKIITRMIAAERDRTPF